MSISFHFIPHDNMRIMLEEAFHLITYTDSWNWLHKYPTAKGFMKLDSKRLRYLSKRLEPLHDKNPVIFSIIMAHMEYIAKYGWENYVIRFKAN